MEASQRLGVGADEMGRKWDKLKKGESLLKFGGGFYCGQLEGLYAPMAPNHLATNIYL